MTFSWNPFSRKQQSQDNNLVTSSVQTNPNFNTFKAVNDDLDKILASRSIVSQQTAEQQLFANPIWQTLGIDAETLVIPVATNKVDRLIQYRKIARFPECDWCLDEICDEFIHEDDNGNFINLKLPENKTKLNAQIQTIIQDEFKRFINLFKLRDDGYNLIKRFLVEGELAWENIISDKIPDKGIIGVKLLQPEYYETLVDVKNGNPVGLLFDASRYATDSREQIFNNFMGSASVFNSIIPITAGYGPYQAYDPTKCIPLLWSQVTYIKSFEAFYDGNKYVVYPIIEKAKQTYYQLALLQDAAVILRVTRAPERLLFNISTGKMNDNYAKQYVRDFSNSLKSKKVMTKGGEGGKGDIGSVYNPVSMLESYIFGKSDGNDGTSIESVGSSASYNEMEDIKYFLKRFIKQLKVPYSRYETPENTKPAPDQLTYEEHSFMRMIVRLQRRFALGLKNGFIVDLKLRGMWDKYELKDEDLNIKFVEPLLYDIYETRQYQKIKTEMYNDVTGSNKDEFSRMLAMKKYLGYTDDDIKKNYENLMSEAMLEELKQKYADKVKDHPGLMGWSQPIKFTDDSYKDLDSEQAKTDKTKSGDETEGEEGSDTDETSTEEPTSDIENTEEPGGEEAENEETAPPPPTFGLA